MLNRNTRRGGTLTELMVAVVILSVGVLGLFGAFRFIARSTFISRATSLATNLGQERIESLKNLSYYSLQITTATGTDATVTPSILYDTVNYPPETIAIGGITFTRYTYVGMAELTGSDITNVAFTYPDTGLKQITVYIVWNEAGNKKVWSLRNLLENPNINPLDATVSGTVHDGAGNNVASAVVVIEQNEDWGAKTSVTGAYSFSVYHGTYTVRASSTGYSDGVSASFSLAKGGTANVPTITLTAVATGYLTGTAWMNTNLVISQVVASTVTQAGDGTTHDMEYVELYNPTTFPINVGTTGAGYNTIMLGYADETGTTLWDSSFFCPSCFFMTKVTTYVAPSHYYLIANASYFYISGGWIAADAWTNSAAAGPPLTYPDIIKNDKAGGVWMYYDWQHGDPNPYIDIVGWADNNTAPTWYYEGNYIPNKASDDGIGSPSGKQIVRVSSPGISVANLPNFGRAYDSNNNSQDFLYEGNYFNSFTSFIPPKNHAAGAFTPLTGKVPTLLGTTYISASDTNSGSTQAFTAFITSGALSLPYSRFQLAGVSTGVWSVSAAYSPYSASYDNVTVTQNAFTGVPNASTLPIWPGAGLNHMQLTSTTASGYVKGVITDNNNVPISGIVVQGGGASKTTGANGVYFMPVSSGSVTIIANPNNVNPSYVYAVQTPFVTAGAVTTQDFSLSLGGRITGYVTTGTTPLGYQAIAATDGSGSQAGSGVTDTSGNFTIRNISTGTYTIFPVLESGQDVNPNTISTTLTSAGTVFSGTFTVNGAFGSIAGTVSDASGLVTSGALILASTNSIASTPSAIVGSSAPAQVPVYMVSSKADGTFTLPVRGGSTYYLSAYVPVISGANVTVTTKTYSGIIVSPSVATTRNVTIP
jgi:prepilin-type N-terminal cleavage/methylation domain-containing protein